MELSLLLFLVCANGKGFDVNVDLAEASSSRHTSHHHRPSSRPTSTRHAVDAPRMASERTERPARPASRDGPVASSSRHRVSVDQVVHDRHGKLPEREVNIRLEVDGEEVDEDDIAMADRLLDDVPLEVQEAWICEELLFALQVSIVVSTSSAAVAHMSGRRGTTDTVCARVRPDR